MSKFTPGEWTLQKNEPFGWEIYGDGFTVALSNDVDSELDNKQALANGHLIASAPEMYAALKALVEHFRSDDESYYKSDLCTDAIAAIRKAEGKT
jgi:hypothetical protein